MTARAILFLAIIGLSALTAGTAKAEPRNLLAAEASPYLRSHAADPVHWRPWGEDALDEARRLGKPILLSIGYLACHWCHVMQKESYENQKTADLINRLFVPVLLDREERPDVDDAFQHQSALMGLPTGWPLTMFLTPEGHPFYGGGYFPPEPVGGSISFPDLLIKISDLYAENPGEVVALARQTVGKFLKAMRPLPGQITQGHHDRALQYLMSEVDTLSGGFGKSVKHPRWMPLLVIWRAYLETGDEAYREAVLLSLDEMIDRALYDHVGGGFFRYAVDPLWQTPHFEKMIDVNAGLLGLMTEVWRETRDPALRRRIEGTVGFVLSELRLPSGAFASSLDATSPGPAGEREEGAYYSWSENALRSALGPAADPFFKSFALGPLEGAETSGPGVPGALRRENRDDRTDALARLKRLRADRPRPRRDDKILADGNGMMIRALATAGFTLGNDTWVSAAVAAFDAARRSLTGPDGRLRQSAAAGRPGPLATADGLTEFAGAALTLFEITGDNRYYAFAEAWARTAVRHHQDAKDGGFFASADDAPAVQVRHKPVLDGQNPSANARMIELFARLYLLGGDPQWRKEASRALSAVGETAGIEDIGVAGLLHADNYLNAAFQVVLIGDRNAVGTKRLIRALMRRSLPNQILEIVPPGHELPEGHPARYKTQIEGQPTVYVCRGTFCSLPVMSGEDLDETITALRAMRGAPGRG